MTKAPKRRLPKKKAALLRRHPIEKAPVTTSEEKGLELSSRQSTLMAAQRRLGQAGIDPHSNRCPLCRQGLFREEIPHRPPSCSWSHRSRRSGLNRGPADYELPPVSTRGSYQNLTG
jgi:hypothetical protein